MSALRKNGVGTRHSLALQAVASRQATCRALARNTDRADRAFISAEDAMSYGVPGRTNATPSRDLAKRVLAAATWNVGHVVVHDAAAYDKRPLDA